MLYLRRVTCEDPDSFSFKYQIQHSICGKEYIDVNLNSFIEIPY